VDHKLKVLITGANGQLGRELCQRKHLYGFDSLSCDLPLFDITDKENILRTIDAYLPDIIVNTAAYTAVDQAEKEPQKAFAVNRDGAGNLAGLCKALDLPLIHISTDYVFDGQKNAPYHETDPVSPLGVYGKSKAAGEDTIRNTLNNHVIVRTSWLYSPHGSNFVKTMLRLGKTNEQIRVVNDQSGCPTFAGDLAEAILEIARQVSTHESSARGTFHYSNTGKTTWFKFAEKIFECSSKYDTFLLKDLVPVTTEEYPTLARRPENSVLACNLITETFGIAVFPWQDSLTKMLDHLYQNVSGIK
jgi:dTDP-4-dehydrorhamnose reductase